MKAKLNFKFPEDYHRFNRCMKADEAFIAIDSIRELIRRRIKYSDNLTPEVEEILEELRNKIHDILVEYDLLSENLHE
jgi:hypothetical protein